MQDRGKSGRRLECRLAQVPDREQIYAMRHEVYARELGQHELNAEGRLSDDLDAHNVYYVVAEDARVLGFVSVTPPESPHYSIDKYLARDDLPLTFDDGLFEIRLLTVSSDQRGRVAAQFLLYAALRCVEERGGRQIVAIGRRELAPYYERYGVERLGREVVSGRVTYDLMFAPVARVARIARSRHRASLRRALRSIAWKCPEEFALEGSCFHGGASVTAVPLNESTSQARSRIVAADVLDAWFPPAPGVVAALSGEAEWLARAAPPAAGEPLRAALSGARRVPEGSLVLGAGSSDLIFRAFTHWLGPGARVLVPDPTYGEYAHVLERVIGCHVERFPLRREEGFEIDLEAWSARLAGGSYELAVLVNPNNPAGTFVPRAALLAALEKVPSSTRVWIDEAYAEYAPEDISLEAVAAVRPGLTVCRSMSKAYALSGLRAASLCTHPCTARELNRITPPWIVGLPGQVAGLHALADPGYYRERYADTVRLRAELAEALRALGLVVTTGHLNAMLVDLPEGAPDAAELAHRARREGVYVRDLTVLSNAFPGRTVRIAVRSGLENERLAAVLGRIVSDRR